MIGLNNELNINGVIVVKTSRGDVVHLDEKNLQGCLAYVKKSEWKIISIHTSYSGKPSYNSNDLEVLKLIDFPIDEILVFSLKIKDWSGLYYLKSLNTLRVNWLDGVIVDFSKIKGLKSIWVDWNKKQSNLFLLKDLEVLRLWKYKPKISNLEELEKLKALTSLEIIQSNIKNISGVEKLKSLKSLGLAYNRNLEILKSDITEPQLNLESLDIEACKKINLDFVKLFPNLKKLRIVNNGTIKSLRPILDGLPKLEEIFIGESLIEESDNEYYKDYKNIKRFFFAEKRHHKLKLKELPRW